MPDEQNAPRESRFRKEDMLLYILSFLMIGFLTYVVVDTRNSMMIAFEHEASIKKIPDEKMFEFESQRTRYDYATKCLISNSVRVNMGFLVGVVISLMGVILVIRQVRDTIGFGAKTRIAPDLTLKTTSPGVLVTLMGCVIILTSIFSKDEITLDAEVLEASRRKTTTADSLCKSLMPKESVKQQERTTEQSTPDTSRAGR